MHKEELLVKSTEVDELKKLRISSFFRMFQDVSVAAVEEIGKGNSFNESKGLIWVVTRADVKIYRMPDYLEPITFYTYPSPTLRFIYPRHFLVVDKNNQPIIRMVTTWALLDDKTRKIAILKEGEFNLEFESHDGELPLPKKIDIPLGELKKEVTISYTDCDLNRHLNNTRYIDYIMDLHDSDFYLTHEITNFRIDYMLEVKEKQNLKLYENFSNNISFVTGMVNEKVVFQAVINFKDVKKDEK